MNALAATAVTALTIAALAAVAEERMRAYGLEESRFGVRTIALPILVTIARALLALRGIGGFDTSIAFAIAAVSAITDLRCGYVFDRVLVAGGIGLLAAEASHGRLGAALAGAASGASAMAIPWAISRARGMGFADVKLAGVLGSALGPYGALTALWLAFVIGAIVAVGGIAFGRHARARRLPFAPFLALGAVLSAGRAAW